MAFIIKAGEIGLAIGFGVFATISIAVDISNYVKSKKLKLYAIDFTNSDLEPHEVDKLCKNVTNLMADARASGAVISEHQNGS